MDFAAFGPIGQQIKASLCLCASALVQGILLSQWPLGRSICPEFTSIGFRSIPSDHISPGSYRLSVCQGYSSRASTLPRGEISCPRGCFRHGMFILCASKTCYQNGNLWARHFWHNFSKTRSDFSPMAFFAAVYQWRIDWERLLHCAGFHVETHFFPLTTITGPTNGK